MWMNMDKLDVMFVYIGEKFVGLVVCFVVDEGRIVICCVGCILVEFCG